MYEQVGNGKQREFSLSGLKCKVLAIYILAIIYYNRIGHLNLPSLEYRRKDLIHLYQTLKENYDIIAMKLLNQA